MSSLEKDTEALYIVVRVCKVLSFLCSNEQEEKQREQRGRLLGQENGPSSLEEKGVWGGTILSLEIFLHSYWFLRRSRWSSSCFHVDDVCIHDEYHFKSLLVASPAGISGDHGLKSLALQSGIPAESRNYIYMKCSPLFWWEFFNWWKCLCGQLSLS